MNLDNDTKTKISVDFAGEFESVSEREAFLRNIQLYDKIHYHGLVTGNDKKKLLYSSHVFCLPTSLFEGQPISILEAYASGCVVLTTVPDGIADIFTDGINGFKIQKKCPDSITTVIDKILLNSETMYPIAVNNRNLADTKFRQSIYKSSMNRILNSVIIK
jgi:glycosyltransferase involved in cell wall biosynthesis